MTRAEARAAVRAWHSHHDPHRGERLAIGDEVDGALVAVVVAGDPVAPAFAKLAPRVLEVTRHCVGPGAPPHECSRLLGAIWRALSAAGVVRLVSYTRVDEAGTCYRAAGWVATALVDGREHTTGNRALRWLPGLYQPSTEVVDRVRWEIGPDAAATRVRRVDGAWKAAA